MHDAPAAKDISSNVWKGQREKRHVVAHGYRAISQAFLSLSLSPENFNLNIKPPVWQATSTASTPPSKPFVMHDAHGFSAECREAARGPIASCYLP